MIDASKWFVAAAESTVELLQSVGEASWASRIHKAVEDYARDGNVEPFLQFFEGHGSLNDLILSPRSGHKVTPHQYPWVNTLLQSLLSLSSGAAQAVHAREKFAPLWFEWHRKLQGWICNACEFTSLSGNEIESALAGWTIGDELKPESPGELKRAVEVSLKGDSATVAQRRETLRHNAKLANISLDEKDRDSRAGMKPCPKCGSDRTSVFRWILEDDDSTLTAADSQLARKGGSRARKRES
jgi:hypothetical protein